MFDLTVALTAHSESVVAGPTMRSVDAAIHAAEVSGFRIERLLGFDTPGVACRAFMTQPLLSTWKTVDLEFRDQGKMRNELAKLSHGRWIAFLDADDLFSENWLVEAAMIIKRAESVGDHVIVHPEINWVFDAGSFVFSKPAQEDSLFNPYYFYCANYYDALCIAPREAWLECPYADRAVGKGFAYEDWQWAIETMANGWRHVVAENTIIFKRRRDTSQTLEARDNAVLIRALDVMAIDRVKHLADAH